MLWKDNLPYDFKYDGKGKLTIIEKFSYKIRRAIPYGILFSILLIVINLFNRFTWHGIFILLLMVCFISLLFLFAIINSKRLDKAITFNAIENSISVNGERSWKFSDITLLRLNIEFYTGNSDSNILFSCVLDLADNDKLFFRTYRDGLLAAILVDEISRHTNIEYRFGNVDSIYHQLYLVEYNQCVKAKKDFDNALTDYVEYSDAELQRIISLQKMSNTIGYKAASTTLRRRKQKQTTN